MQHRSKLTPGERNTLEGIAEQHMRGIRCEGTPFYLIPKGGQRGLCLRWEAAGLLTSEWCGDYDSSDDKERLGFTFTEAGIEFAKGHGVAVVEEQIAEEMREAHEEVR